MKQYNRLVEEMQAQQQQQEDEVDWGLTEDEGDEVDFYSRRSYSSYNIDKGHGNSEHYVDNDADTDFLTAEGFQVEEVEEYTSLEDKLDELESQGPFNSTDSTSVLSDAIEKAVDTGNTGLVALTAIGRDTVTGKFSNQAIMNNLISKLPSETFQPRMVEETNDEGEVVLRVASTFDENELKQLESIILNTVQTRKAIDHLHSGEDFHKRLKEINSMIKEIRAEIKQQEIELEPLESEYHYYKPFYDIVLKDHRGESLTHDEVIKLETIISLGLQQFVREFNAKEREYMSVKLKLDNNRGALRKAQENRKQVERELANSKTDIIKNPILEKAQRVITNMSKITQVQFGYSLRDANFKEAVVGLSCGCGHTDVYKFDLLPRFISGDILGDFKGRAKTNAGTTKNYFDINKGTKESKTKYTLLKANADTYLASRLIIPGVTEEGEALMCTKCAKFLLFTPEIYQAMAERGHMQDIWLFEYSKSEEGKLLDIKEGILIYISEEILNPVYLADLGLTAYKANVISSKINKVDTFNSSTALSPKRSLISEDYLMAYAKENGISMDLSKVEANLMNKANSLNNKLSEIISAENKKVNSTREDKSGKKELARANVEFLKTCRDIILEWAFHENFTADLMRININNLLNDKTAFGRLISERTVKESLESIVTGKPILIFESGRLISIENKQANLPHAKFIACYYDLVFDYIMNIHRKMRSGDRALYNAHKVFFDIQKISNKQGQAALSESEDLVVALIRMLDNTYYEQRSKYFNSYITADAFNLNFTDDNYTSDWVYYEMISQNNMPRHAQPLDEKKFAYRYGRRLSEEGVTDMYDSLSKYDL